MIETRTIDVTVNGQARTLDVAVHHTLLDVLRDDLALTGAKTCCLVGECGACTVLIDGRSVDACLVLGVEADGQAITTVEGLADDDRLHPVQAAFLETGAVQCGFCIPGQIVSAAALIDATPHPTRPEIEEGLAGNLCRCAGYEQIIEAVQLAAASAAADPNGVVGAEASPRPADPTGVATRPDADVAPQ